MTRGLRSELVRCAGGLNLESPYLEILPGQLIGSKNYEQKQTGGYRRIDGYTKVCADVVPGSLAIAAVAQHDGTTFAWRLNSGVYKLYYTTGTSWTEVNLGVYITFNTGSVEPAEGTVVTIGGGITGTVSRIQVTSGAWSSADAAGFMSLRAVVGDWSTAIAGTNITNVGATITYCKAAAAGEAVSVTGEPRSGIYHNFYGSANDGAFYWCDGTKYIIEVRPSTKYAAVSLYVCDYLCAHNEHLFHASAAGGDVTCSVPGSPFLVDGAIGSIDKATGAGVSGFASYKGVLAVLGDSQTSIIYGKDSSDFQLQRLDGVGSMPSIKEGVAVGVEGRMLFLSQSGLLFDLAATQEYGNFNSSAITQQVQRALISKRARVTAVGRRADKGQVRVFYNDGSAYYFTFFGASFVGVLPQKFPIAVKCYATNADASVASTEVAVFGSDDGYVYKMDDGEDFAGTPIESFAIFPFWHMSSPIIRKRWRSLFVEGSGSDGTVLRIKQSYDMTGANSGLSIDQDFEGGGAGIWGSAIWGQFVWGGSYGADLGYELVGTSKNMSVTIYCDGSGGGAHEIDSLVVNYTLRGVIRD